MTKIEIDETWRPTLIGFSVTLDSHLEAVNVARVIYEYYFGGAHVSAHGKTIRFDFDKPIYHDDPAATNALDLINEVRADPTYKLKKIFAEGTTTSWGSKEYKEQEKKENDLRTRFVK